MIASECGLARKKTQTPVNLESLIVGAHLGLRARFGDLSQRSWLHAAFANGPVAKRLRVASVSIGLKTSSEPVTLCPSSDSWDHSTRCSGITDQVLQVVNHLHQKWFVSARRDVIPRVVRGNERDAINSLGDCGSTKIRHNTPGELMATIGHKVLIAIGVLYAGYSAWHLASFAVGGKITVGPNYFWCWDMFPGYETWSHRTYLIGETSSGDGVQLYPGPREQLITRPGGISRLDFFASYQNAQAQQLHRAVYDQEVRRYRRLHPAAPLVQVIVIEHFWPIRSNAHRQPDYMPPIDHEARYSRVLDTASVDANGEVQWSADQEGEP